MGPSRMSSYSVTEYKALGAENKTEMLEGRVNDLTQKIDSLSEMLSSKKKQKGDRQKSEVIRRIRRNPSLEKKDKELDRLNSLEEKTHRLRKSM